MKMHVNGHEIRCDSAWVAASPATEMYKAQPAGLRVWPLGAEAFTVPLTEDTPEARQAADAEARDILRSLYDRRADA
jgi:hypothetical protein